MGSTWIKNLALLASCGGLAACGNGTGEQPVNTDYSALRLAPSHQGALHYATSDEQLLRPLRNGLRMSLVGMPEIAAVTGLTAPSAAQDTFSATTVQVAGVDEADLVKYDGQYIYSMRSEPAPATPGFTRNVLTIARTHPQSATAEKVSEFDLPGEQTTLPQLYQLQSAQGTTQSLVAVSQDFAGWMAAQPAFAALVVRPDRTRIQLLDVQDPSNPSQVWQIEIDGWLRASRKIDDVLYLVNSYRPRLSDLVLPANTDAEKRANELRIRNAPARDLLPGYSENGGAERQLLAAGDCVLPAGLEANDAYSDLVVITAIDLTERRVTDVNCVSTDVNGVYVSHDSLYVGGQGFSVPESNFTVLHKFALDGNGVDYRASGVVGGLVGWQNASYFMDEHDGDFRILTSQFQVGGEWLHRLHVVRERPERQLTTVATLPNPQRTTPIGKPGEQVHAVRFFGDRAYVVTARIVDPLYVLDLSVPEDPVIAGTLEIPGVSTYLQPVGPAGSELVLAVGGQTDDAGLRDGVKIELFDVHDILRPRSIGTHVFGRRGSSSEATADPHALTLLPQPAAGRLRLALPIDVFATPRSGTTDMFDWSYSGSHLLEIDGIGGSAPQLAFKGVIKTAEPAASDPFPFPPYVAPRRAVMHDDAVFVVDGATLIGRQWDGVTQF